MFGVEIGLLFQVVDDILDGDGLASHLSADDVRRLADDAAERARAALDAVAGDTSVLRELTDSVAFRTV